MIAQPRRRVGSIRMLGCSSDLDGKGLGAVMHRQDVNLVGAHESIDDAVRPVNNLPDERVLEFRNCPPRLGDCAKRSVAAMRRVTTTEA